MSEQARLEQRIDPATPQRLLRQGGERLLHAVTRAFLDRWQERADELARALAADELRDAGRIAHGLRSSCDLVGATHLARLCGEVEARADAGAGPAARETMESLGAGFQEVRPWIEAHAGR